MNLDGRFLPRGRAGCGGSGRMYAGPVVLKGRKTRPQEVERVCRDRMWAESERRHDNTRAGDETFRRKSVEEAPGKNEIGFFSQDMQGLV